jgi:hypothetical protein
VNRLALLACFLIAALPAQGSDEQLRYFIPGDTFEKPSSKTQAAMLTALCEGTVKEGVCDTCPSSNAPGGGFTLDRVILGHFLQANSIDAFVTIAGCEQMHASIAWGFLLSRRESQWETVQDMLGLDLNHCHKMRFRSGRQLLVCEDYRMESFHLMHNVEAIHAEADAIHLRNLLTATDTTRMCDEQTHVRKGQIDRIEFRDLNADGIEDLSFTVSLGSMRDSKRRQQLCEAAQPVKSKVRRLEPTAMKSYQIDYLFDGRQFKLTPGSEAAAKLFQPEE